MSRANFPRGIAGPQGRRFITRKGHGKKNLSMIIGQWSFARSCRWNVLSGNDK
jgi:hypothetical protein